jgi:hypothetical protein
MMLLVSIPLITTCFLFQPVPGGSYADPRGAFNLSVPSGWTTSPGAGEGTVRLLRGGAECTVNLLQGSASGQDMVTQVIGQFANQWQNFNVVDQGGVNFAGQQGSFTAAAGTNRKNVPSLLRVSAVGTGTQVLVLIMSIPQSDYNSLKQDLVKIEQSLAFGGIARPESSPPVAGPPPERLAALDAAYRAGVLSREEYEAKKAALQQAAFADGRNSRQPVPDPSKALLGVTFRPVTDEEAKAWGMKYTMGVVVTELESGGPAQQAGLQPGDIILIFDRKGVRSTGELLSFVAEHKPGDVVELGYYSAGESKVVKIKLAARGFAAPPAPPVPDVRRAPSDQGTMRFARLGIRDPGINNVEAVSLLIPAGWKAEGGVQWYPDYSILANLLLRITDPQTGASIEFLPVQNFTWLTQSFMPMQPGTNYLGNVLWQPITDMPQFVQVFYVPQTLRHLQGAQVVNRQDLPTVAAEVARAQGNVTLVKSERVRYEYAQGGQSWEEDVYCTLIYLNYQLGTLWSVHSAHSLRAPKGQLDRMTPLMEAAVSSLRMSPEWYGGYMYVLKLFENRMAQGIRNAGEISRIISQNSDEISRMFSDSYRERCQADDRIHQSYTEYIRGVDTYRNPFEGRAIQLPSGYRDAWVSAGGEYILSNDANLNPNVGSTTEWRRMEGP